LRESLKDASSPCIAASLFVAQVFYSYLLGAIFFGDRMTLMGLFGVALILAGVLMVTMRSPKGITSRQAAAAAAAAAAHKSDKQAVAANVQLVAVLGASRAASLAAAAAGVEFGGVRQQTASLTPTLSRRASAKAAATGREGLDEAVEQPLLQHVRDPSALQQGTMTASGVADAAVIITATGTLVHMAESETAAAAAPTDGGSKEDGTGGTAEPGMLSAFVQAALQSAVGENDPGSAVDGEFLTNNAALVVWQCLWAEIHVG
jgi:hypothetical protein